MTVLAEYNRETALQMQVSYRFLSNEKKNLKTLTILTMIKVEGRIQITFFSFFSTNNNIFNILWVMVYH